MNENFKKFKAKLMREFYLKISLISLAGGLTVSGLIILFTRMFGANFPFYYSIIIGVVVLIALFLTLFFLKKPNDEKIAERIDKDFKMEEKVTSMVAFKNENGFLYQKQREDAKAQLSKKDVKKLPFKLAVINIPALVFGASLFTASFFTPNVIHETNKNNKPNPDDFNNKTEDIIDDIRDLINNSEASEAFKAELNQILTDLLEDLQDDTDIQSRMQKVIVAEGKVTAALDRANSKEELGAALENSKVDLLAKLGTAIKTGDQEGAASILKQLEKHFGPRTTYTGEALYDHIEAIDESITSALDAVRDDSDGKTVVGKDDTLYLSMENLYKSLDSINKKFSSFLSGDTEKGINEDQAKADSVTAIELAISEIGQCLQTQQENSDLAAQVISYMQSLINPGGGSGSGSNSENQNNNENQNSDGENNNNGNNPGDDADSAGDKNSEGNDGENNGDSSESGDSSDSEGDGDGKGEEGETEGGGNSKGDSESSGSQSGTGASGGNGDTKYGSSDKVYTDQNGYSEYGDVIDGYHNDAGEDNKENGNEETGGILEDYFTSLYGSEKDSGDGKTNP